MLIIAAICVSAALVTGAYLMSAATDRLTAAVQANMTATNAAVAEIAALKSGSDDAVLNAASDQIDQNTAALNDAAGVTSTTA